MPARVLFACHHIFLEVYDELFPILTSGSVRTEIFSLKGYFDEIKRMAQLENRSCMEIRLDCRDFVVWNHLMELPIEQVGNKTLLIDWRSIEN